MTKFMKCWQSSIVEIILWHFGKNVCLVLYLMDNKTRYLESSYSFLNLQINFVSYGLTVKGVGYAQITSD